VEEKEAVAQTLQKVRRIKSVNRLVPLVTAHRLPVIRKRRKQKLPKHLKEVRMRWKMKKTRMKASREKRKIVQR